MADLKSLKQVQQAKLEKALGHLSYSFQKVLKLPNDVSTLDEEMLETWESFAARFARVCDIFLSRYIKTLVLLEDPGFSGTMRDYLNSAEKIGLVDDAKAWLAIRELRNITAHEYSEQDMTIFFETLRKTCPKVLKIKKLLEQMG